MGRGGAGQGRVGLRLTRGHRTSHPCPALPCALPPRQSPGVLGSQALAALLQRADSTVLVKPRLPVATALPWAPCPWAASRPRCLLAASALSDLADSPDDQSLRVPLSPPWEMSVTPALQSVRPRGQTVLSAQKCAPHGSLWSSFSLKRALIKGSPAVSTLTLQEIGTRFLPSPRPLQWDWQAFRIATGPDRQLKAGSSTPGHSTGPGSHFLSINP